MDLFDEEQYGADLERYDLAHQAARYIAAERADDDALALEAALHRLRTSDYKHHRHMALVVPPYLQDLLHGVSAAYQSAFRYDRLIERLLRLPYVFFVTLNYDTLLDRRLNVHHPLRTADDYISDDKNWSLIKLHGSVNWWHPTDKPYDVHAPPSDLAWDGDRFGIASPIAGLSDLRGREFPAPPSSATQPWPCPKGATTVWCCRRSTGSFWPAVSNPPRSTCW